MAETYKHRYTIIVGTDESAVVEWDGEQGKIVHVGPLESCKDYLAKNTTPAPLVPGDYDCQSCGACCRAYFARVNVSAGDIFRLGAGAAIGRRMGLNVIYPDLKHDATGAYIPRPGGLCPYLQETITVGKPYSCGIYEHRPEACRALEPGSPSCLASRQAVGL